MARRTFLIVIFFLTVIIGVIGVAFASGPNTFFCFGTLSAGSSHLSQINVDHVGFLPSNEGAGVDRIIVSFDRDLSSGSTIWITINDNYYGWKVLANSLSRNGEVVVQLNRILKVDEIPSAKMVTVAVAER